MTREELVYLEWLVTQPEPVNFCWEDKEKEDISIEKEMAKGEV